MRYKNKSSDKIKMLKSLIMYAFVLAIMGAMAVGGVERDSIEAYLSQSVDSVAVAAEHKTAADSSQTPAASLLRSKTAGGSADVNSLDTKPVDTPLGVPVPEDASTGAKIQSISFKKDWGIRDALAFLSARYQKNIVPSTKVDGLITVTNLYGVTFDEALDAILGHGFKYEQQGNFIKVYSEEEYKKIREAPERMMTKVFTLYYISSAEVLKLLAPTLSGAGSIQGSSPPEKIMPTGESISAGSGGGDAMALNDTIVVLDYPENIAKVEKLLTELDVRPKQVLVEATILSATLSEQTAFGIDWNSLNGVTIDTILNVGKGVSDGISAYGFASKAVTEKGTIGDGLNIGVTNDHVAVLIRALESVTDLTVLANPKILAVNKQLGQVYIGKKYGYNSQTTVSEGGASTSQVSFLETGTKLSFRPYIGSNGYIRMDIHPKDSDGSVSGGLPTETSTEVATNIMVKDGQTIVIGGLFRDTIDTTRHQVPLLGDLPVVGGAFRSTVDKSKREEVIVMLTPHIIEEPSQTEGLARAEDISRKRSAAKDEMQWIDRARRAQDSYAKAVKFYLQGDNESAMRELVVALKFRPTYLEAVRLKEKIIAEVSPDDAKKMERIILESMDRKEAPKWRRR